MNTGSFSENSLEIYQDLLSSLMEEEIYDFARCVRPDGTFYGTRGKCTPPNKPAEGEGKDAEVKTSVPKKDRKMTQGVSVDSYKVLSNLVNQNNRQQAFVKDAISL